MKNRFKKSQRRLKTLQRARHRYHRAAPMPTASSKPVCTVFRKVLIYAGELIRLLRETLRYGAKRLETGGQFFGHVSSEGVVIIDFVLVSGPAAEHSHAFFRQDIRYLEQVGNRLIAMQLIQLGEWHSHHKLGIPIPSGHDSQSMLNTIWHQEIQQYLLCIATCDDGKANATPYMYNRDGYEIWSWDIIPGESPVRKMMERI